jgi:membrane protein implicated in regulation of membrane protease activity
MFGFVAIGALGLLLLLLSVLLDDLLDGVFDFGGGDFGGLLSGPVLSAFLAAFGFGAAATMAATGASVAISTLGGLASGAVVGTAAGLLVRSISSMPTDITPSSATLEGASGVVVTPIGAERTGEVLLTVVGSPVKVSARSEGPVALGVPVKVTAVVSPTLVVVSPLA